MSQSEPTHPAYADFAAVVSYGPSLSFSPDGDEIAVSSNASGQYNLWALPVAGGNARQLTSHIDQAVRQIAWSPRGGQILFTADQQGDEKHQLYLIDPTGAVTRSLTNRPDVQYFLADKPWSSDERYLAFAGNDREETAQDVIVRELPTGEDDRPLKDGQIYDPVSWSPDDRYFVSILARSNTDLVVVLTDIESGDSRQVLGAEDASLYSPGPWSADGSGFWLVSDDGREFAALAFCSIATGVMDWVETPEWDVESVAASADGRYLAWSVNENGASRIHLKSLENDETVDLGSVPQGVLRSSLVFSPSGDQLAFFLESATTTSELYVVEIEERSCRKLTNSLRKDLSSVDMIEPVSVHFPTFDDRHIPAWLYRPEGEGPFPVLLSIHGGPEAQERPTYAYRGFYQYLLSRGIGVLAPNIRGSTGYGKSYQKLIHRDLGGNDVHDFEAAARYLQDLDWVDPDRIGVFGGSYGGFAVLTCVSRLPDYWAAAVDIVGPSNLVTMLKSFPPTWREMAKSIFGDVDTEEEDLLRRSPITYVDQIDTPLFIIQGANDPRVVKAESDQIVEELRDRGVEVRYDVYEDEGHGFTKKTNELKALGDAGDFFVEQLVGSLLTSPDM